MSPSTVLKSTTSKKAASRPKQACPQPKTISCPRTEKGISGRDAQQACGGVVIRSYTELLSCNGDFTLPFKCRIPAALSESWSTEVHVDEVNSQYTQAYKRNLNTGEGLIDERQKSKPLQKL